MQTRELAVLVLLLAANPAAASGGEAEKEFQNGEIRLKKALEILSRDPVYLRDGTNAKIPAPALKILEEAENAYEIAAKKAPDQGLRCSALYRLAETAYNRKEFNTSIERFKAVEYGIPDCYLVPDSLLGLANAYLGASDFAKAEEALVQLSQRFPRYADDPRAAFALGVISFFLSVDYDGAISKYEQFLRAFPFSRLKSAALYRIGSARFQKREFGQSRLSFGAMISQFPNDFYAPLAKYFIGESYRLNGQMRDALFAYSKIAGQHKDSPVYPSALYRIAWAQHELGNKIQAAQTCEIFLDQFASHKLAPNAYLLKGISLAALGKKEEALTAYQRVLDSAPETEAAEQALYLSFRTRHEQGEFGSVLTATQFLFNQLPPSQ